MRRANGDGSRVLPWLLIRQDRRGNRYRVGSYATRVEAQRTADRLGGARAAASEAGVEPEAEGYVVESRPADSSGSG
ncbi:hypothetical protein [Streptomyces oceani]|uniref:SPOR domain-containing protein n=1 Tax=Streptomyces oceani TaxID=1075402 RepID=A0A1E7JJ38_9ACTN|nr:hypothetical protein [Streptomyces oceani]OEU87667.1 hypothetical protein AN216_26065 [Streptomyces oceani]